MSTCFAPPTNSIAMETRKIDSIVTGHHVYKTVWTPFIGEILGTEQEQATNVHDRYAVSVMKKGKIVGHMPRTISKVSWHFLQHGGVINCKITGKRREGNGLEVPCQYSFVGTKKIVQKLS